MVPIEPRWHRLLFPDGEPVEDTLFPATLGLSAQPFGNALRKAYLCNASSRLLRPGDPLLFYRSRDQKAVYVVGVCEDTLVSQEPDEIIATVGRRTVYSLQEIQQRVLPRTERRRARQHAPAELMAMVRPEIYGSWTSL